MPDPWSVYTCDWCRWTSWFCSRFAWCPTTTLHSASHKESSSTHTVLPSHLREACDDSFSHTWRQQEMIQMKNLPVRQGKVPNPRLNTVYLMPCDDQYGIYSAADGTSFLVPLAPICVVCFDHQIYGFPVRIAFPDCSHVKFQISCARSACDCIIGRQPWRSVTSINKFNPDAMHEDPDFVHHFLISVISSTCKCVSLPASCRLTFQPASALRHGTRLGMQEKTLKQLHRRSLRVTSTSAANVTQCMTAM